MLELYFTESNLFLTQYLRRLCEPSLNVKNLASEICCAPDYLSNIFRKETGIKLKDYINSQRIEYAKDLLKNSTLNVSEIAWTVGFADDNYFFSVFRKFEKITPNKFRNKNSIFTINQPIVVQPGVLRIMHP